MKKKYEKLSIIIPIYNEEKTIVQIIERVQKVKFNPIDKEIIIVNDASRDNSKKEIKKLMKKYDNMKYIEHETNLGKGAAIRTGLNYVTGEYVTIQDGDLEYNPENFKKMIELITDGHADVIYGSRILGKITGFKIVSHYYGNLFLSFITRIFYGERITDMETCYKMTRKEIIKDLNLKSNRFDIEPEITAKLIKKGYSILEIPIDYNARSFEEGKKINWKDGLSAIIALLKYRIFY